MENSAWKAERGTALGSTSRDATFSSAYMRGALAVGVTLKLLALDAGDRTVAMETHLIDGPVLFSFKIAFDPAYRRFSPGTILKYRVIERLEGGPWKLGDCARHQTTCT